MPVPIEVLPLRDRAVISTRWLRHRLDTVLPQLMEREGVDAWVLVAREYNEDPVLTTMLPPTWFTTRRRTIVVFTERGRKRAAISRYGVGDALPSTWDPAVQPDQWQALAHHLDSADPATIAINRSETFALADGLSSTEHASLQRALPDRLRSRLVSAERLAVGWLETRSAPELECYPEIVALSHDVVRQGLTEQITPGSTTTEDLEWWFRQTVADLTLSTWFQPTVSVQRRGASGRESFSDHPEAVAIRPGDLVHVDFGIEYLGLHTDMQQHSYVLEPGETAPPRGLETALGLANRTQDLLMNEFVAGRTGNEILQAALSQTRAAGIDATIYTHAIGLHGHAAGPTIGLWDQQGGVPGAGDHPLFPDTAYSIELSVAAAVPEWGGETVRIMVEEDAFFDGRACTFLDGRQTRLWLVA